MNVAARVPDADLVKQPAARIFAELCYQSRASKVLAVECARHAVEHELVAVVGADAVTANVAAKRLVGAPALEGFALTERLVAACILQDHLARRVVDHDETATIQVVFEGLRSSRACKCQHRSDANQSFLEHIFLYPLAWFILPATTDETVWPYGFTIRARIGDWRKLWGFDG